MYGCENWSLTLREERRLSLYKSRVPRRIFGPKREEVTGELRKLHNEELNDMYASPNIVRVIKPRRMIYTGHVARMGEKRGSYRVLVGNLRERDHLEDSGVDGMIILKWIFRKWNVRAWTGSNWLRIGKDGGHFLMP